MLTLLAAHHEESSLAVSRADLRSLLATIERVRGERDDLAALMDEAELGARVMQSDHEVALDEARKDGERLDWLEKNANGYPIEVDAFTGMREANGESADAVFVTVYPCGDGTICEREGCANRHISKQTTRLLGRGRTLREALDVAQEREA
jgi:hypothetical protein